MEPAPLRGVALGTLLLSIPKAGALQHPHCAPSLPLHSAVGPHVGFRGAVSSQKGLGHQLCPILSPLLAGICCGTTSNPTASSGSCIPHAQRMVALIRSLIWSRQRHGDPQATSSLSLQTKAAPWAKPSGHPRCPILGAWWSLQTTLWGPSALGITKEQHSGGAGFNPFPPFSQHEATP